ncbi:DUF2262 domain-containing protein [Schaalia odontolytica]|uniref:DUF2262 domain-containing protein n=1 Tax=Schaalia odontolytica TaxID=1660 RepID=UPI00211CA5BA|nr:DUF2262 domain-containing protein [Schaalia odontolytica]UUO93585.1 DUF2262 domain-containing protein [Schaalia odontolytica]
MDLLEYMRSQNGMTQEEWERTFEDEATEILVLLAGGRGASKRNGFWEVAHYFIAYVDCQTGALHAGEGRIVYPVSDEEHDAGGILDRFGQEMIYRVKARKEVPQEVPEGVAASVQNHFLIVEVLEEEPPCPVLEEVLAEYRQPVVVADEELGELTLDKDYDVFEGHVLWQGEQIDVSLEVDAASEDTWTAAVQAMRRMVADQAAWDRDMRAFAARELTQLACEWRESADEEVPEITEGSFARRIELRSIAMDAEGSFSAYFDDDDMFFGHCVVVYGTVADGVASVEMAG